MIRTARLVLEPLSVAHAPAMFALLSDPTIYTYLDYGPPSSLEHVERGYAQLETRRSPDGLEEWLNWIVTRDGVPIGFVQATIYPDRSANVAYILGSAYWGCGYAHEAVEAMLAELEGCRPFATVDERNARSIRLLERLGFRHVGGERYER